MICLCALTAQAQSVAGYEYWFDNQFDSRITENTSSGDIVLETDVSTLAEVCTTSTSEPKMATAYGAIRKAIGSSARRQTGAAIHSGNTSIG